MTVAQYMFLGREKKKGVFIDDRAMENDAARYLERIGAQASPWDLMKELPVAKQQLVEIAKALTYQTKLLVMDEPTTALGEKETAVLFEIIRSLKAQGISVIYISHRLEEIGQIADRITVMKDGLQGRSAQTSAFPFDRGRSSALPVLWARAERKRRKRSAALIRCLGAKF